VTWEQLNANCWTTEDWSMVVEEQGNGTWLLREVVTGGRSRPVKTFDGPAEAMAWADDWAAGRVTA
jgi:hypothetical protein